MNSSDTVRPKGKKVKFVNHLVQSTLSESPLYVYTNSCHLNHMSGHKYWVTAVCGGKADIFPPQNDLLKRPSEMSSDDNVHQISV